jgi:ankyrin repeat protein
VNARQADGTSALHWAAHRDNLEMVDLLLRAGAQVSAANRYGVMPLSLACTNGSAAVIERLLDAGADPNAALPGGETPLMTAARTGSVEAVRRLIARGADVNARESARGQTALMWAAAHGNAAVVPLLLEAGADLSARSHGPVSKAEPGAKGLQFRDYSRQGRLDDFTALLFAARAGHIDAVRALLAGGADPNEAAPDGSTVLVVAAVNAHWELAALLLDHGADPNASLQGWTPLHQVVRTRTLNIGQFPHPVPTGRLTSLDLARKLVEFGADVNARMTKELRDGYRGGRFNRLGATPMLLAAKGADFEMMRLLAAAGADPNLTNRTRTTVLMAAAGVGMFYVEEDSGTNEDALEAVKVALELGGDVTAVDDNGNTALHGGAWRGSNPIVQLLIDRGAKLDAKNKGGFTPLQVANGEETTNAGLQRRPETVALLRQLMTARGLPVDLASEVAAGRH